jgi:large subunit ribosomal protein L3
LKGFGWLAAIFYLKYFVKFMDKFILGKKIGMTTLYEEKGALNVTLLECFSKVSLIKSKDKDGYNAVQMEIAKSKKKFLKKEFRVDETVLKEGDVCGVSIFEVGEKIRITGISKSKGFQGVVKRHGFKGSPASHGHKHDLRAPGSIGSGFPEHVVKGKRMAGRMGGKRTTTRNLGVVFIDKENNLLGIKGAVPGIPGGIVEIRTI